MGGEFYEEIEKNFEDGLIVRFNGNEYYSIILTEEDGGFEIQISEKTFKKIIKFIEVCRKSIDDYDKEQEKQMGEK